MMINSDQLVDAIQARECVVSRKSLRSGEVFASSESLPELYDTFARTSGPLLSQLLKASMRLGFERPEALESPDVENAIRTFWSRVLSRSSEDDEAREDVLQAYLYFWASDPACRGDSEYPVLEECYIPQNSATWDNDSVFCKQLVGRVAKTAAVDMVGHGTRELYLVEVKYDSVDDRAVGQSLRYFQHFRQLRTTVDHLCDLRRVVPVIVAKSFPDEQWKALSPAMRELVRVCFFEIEEDRVVLRDGKQALLSRLRGSKQSAF